MNDNLRKGLTDAADAIGAANYKRQWEAHCKRRSPRTFRFQVTPTHGEIVQALNEDWDDERACALLHTYQHDAERWGDGLNPPVRT